MSVHYQSERIDAAQFADILHRSGLAGRRPADDLPRLQKMLDHADILITARDEATGRIVGVARSLSDFAYACYLSDLAVDAVFQGRGIGRRLIDLTREAAGAQSMCLLLSAPDATGFYERIDMPAAPRAFMFPRAE